MTLNERIAQYLAACPPAISGQNGSGQTYFVACQLTHGFGLGESEALSYMQLYNQRCSPPWSEKEIEHKVRDAAASSKHEKARGHLIAGSTGTFNHTDLVWRPPPKVVVPTKSKTKSPQDMADWWTSGARISDDQMRGQSPMAIPDLPADQSKLIISSLYSEKECVNIVCAYIEEAKKAKPVGSGKTLPRDQWIAWITEKGTPQADAGAWMRPNPCSPTGSGNHGAITDADVTDFRFLLVESDSIAIASQLAFFAKIRLPVSAILLSGGGSAHAWIKIGASNLRDYKSTATKILELLKPFGFDPANSNASRLSRLAGAKRKIGSSGDGLQKLVWLNPNAIALTESALIEFEESLLFPAIEEKPLLAIAREAIERYEYMWQNQGKLGVPTGIPALDEISGGWKPSQTIVVAGSTGGGKTTVALHMIDTALRAGTGVLLFSLEMDKEEIFDLILSNRCGIDRNKFNNGRFGDNDFIAMRNSMGIIRDLPLYIEDSALSAVEQIRIRVVQLKAAGKIGLVVVDYLQFVNPGIVTRENREQQVAQISHALRAMARETKLPFIILSQLNDEGKLRESRVIAHNANIVMIVEATEDVVIAKIIKGRGIPCGEYSLDFERRFARLVPKKAPLFP